MELSANNRINFGWNIKTHSAVTRKAVEKYPELSHSDRTILARCSQMPDLMKGELEDMCAAHFYDATHEDPSFGTINDDKNNALSRFLHHNENAEQLLKANKREEGLREAGYAAHYLQDAATPPHTEHGNYVHKLFRLPMHKNFEKGKKYGASSRLKFLTEHYVHENLPFSNLASLFHSTALYSVQTENHVNYLNKRLWPRIQQRCFNRSINATQAYFDYLFRLLKK